MKTFKHPKEQSFWGTYEIVVLPQGVNWYCGHTIGDRIELRGFSPCNAQGECSGCPGHLLVKGKYRDEYWCMSWGKSAGKDRTTYLRLVEYGI